MYYPKMVKIHTQKKKIDKKFSGLCSTLNFEGGQILHIAFFLLQ